MAWGGRPRHSDTLAPLAIADGFSPPAHNMHACVNMHAPHVHVHECTRVRCMCIYCTSACTHWNSAGPWAPAKPVQPGACTHGKADLDAGSPQPLYWLLSLPRSRVSKRPPRSRFCDDQGARGCGGRWQGSAESWWCQGIKRPYWVYLRWCQLSISPQTLSSCPRPRTRTRWKGQSVDHAGRNSAREEGGKAPPGPERPERALLPPAPGAQLGALQGNRPSAGPMAAARALGILWQISADPFFKRDQGPRLGE